MTDVPLAARRGVRVKCSKTKPRIQRRGPEIMKTLRETAFAADEELIAPMMWWRYNGQPAGNGWTSPANNGAFGTDYYHRTGAVKADPYDNKRNETMYFYTDNDLQLQQLEGESSYTSTFPKVAACERLLAIDDVQPRNTSLSERAEALCARHEEQVAEVRRRWQPDHLSREQVAWQREGLNWLPAPEGNFSIWVRADWPYKAILDGTWKPPVIKVVN